MEAGCRAVRSESRAPDCKQVHCQDSCSAQKGARWGSTDPRAARAQPAALRAIMPPLVLKWQALGDTDRELLPLLECLTSLAQALGARRARVRV
jgi:hypothetical protein